MRTFSHIVAIATAGLLAAGCLKYTTPVAAPRQMTAAERNFDRLWQASQTVLRKYYFNLDREDRRAGILTTEPLVGRHWFELWRHDAVGPGSQTESSLQTIYRIAEVKIEPTAPGAATYQPTVKVYTFRSDRPSPQVTNTSEAINLFAVPGNDVRPAGNVLTPTPPVDELEPGGPPPEAEALPDWLVPVGKDGRDQALEQVLTAKIKRAAGL